MRALIPALVFCGCASAPADAKRPTPSQPALQPQPAWQPQPEPQAQPPKKLTCSRPRDCSAGNACCTTPLWDGTQCAARCDLANTGQVCSEDSECPEIGAAKTRCLAVSSQDFPGLPPSLTICQ